MPTITIDGPPLKDLEKKRVMVRKLHDAAVEAYGIEEIVVVIREHQAENVALKGKLLVDIRKENPSPL